MKKLHEIGVTLNSQASIELINPAFMKEELLRSRLKTITVMHQIRESLVEGMTEEQARKLALQIFLDHGVTKHWHPPYIRFGKGTALTFHDPLQGDEPLKENQPFYIDLGPVWPNSELGLEYEGDYGDSFVLGENEEAEKCIKTARLLFTEAQDEWRKNSLTGEEIYSFLRKRCDKYGYKLMEDFDGHRLSDFPHHQYTKERLKNIGFVPSNSLWILEIQINDQQDRFGAFFEDLLF